MNWKDSDLGLVKSIADSNEGLDKSNEGLEARKEPSRGDCKDSLLSLVAAEANPEAAPETTPDSGSESRCPDLLLYNGMLDASPVPDPSPVEV